MKTNAARILDRRGIRYELRDYPVDESDLSAETVTRKVGLPEAQVFKTLLAREDKNGPCFAVVPAGRTCASTGRFLRARRAPRSYRASGSLRMDA